MTDTQRLKAAIYSTGNTPTTFAKAMGIDPRTLKKELSGTPSIPTRKLSAFNETMQRLSQDWKPTDAVGVFFAKEITRGHFAKPYFLAVLEFGLHITEDEAAEKAGIDLETLRSLYNACRADEQLKAAYGVWEALGQAGNWESFFYSFLDYQDTPTA